MVEGEKFNLEAARVFTGEGFFGISYVFKVSKNQSNESINSICIGEVFQVEVSDDLIHPLNLYLEKCFWGHNFGGVCVCL